MVKEVCLIYLLLCFSLGTQLIPFWSQVSEDSLFFHKVKPLTRYLNALRITLSGKYANFAIFGLVGDTSFEKTVKLSADVLMCVSDDELRASGFGIFHFLPILIRG